MTILDHDMKDLNDACIQVMMVLFIFMKEDNDVGSSEDLSCLALVASHMSYS